MAFGTGVLRQTADDVKIENLFVELTDTGLTPNLDDQDPAAYFPDTALASTVVRNCMFKGDEITGWSMRFAIEYGGVYEDCTGGNFSFGSGGTVNGTFINCTGGDYSFGYSGDGLGGNYYFCSGGTNSFSGTGGPTISYCLVNGVPYP